MATHTGECAVTAHIHYANACRLTPTLFGLGLIVNPHYRDVFTAGATAECTEVRGTLEKMKWRPTVATPPKIAPEKMTRILR